MNTNPGPSHDPQFRIDLKITMPPWLRWALLGAIMTNLNEFGPLLERVNVMIM